MTNLAQRHSAPRRGVVTEEADEADEPHRRLMELSAQRTMELIYFAHIDQAHLGDHVLVKHGIGRPHHRVLYFANKKPGISVRELMALLRITNQALARTTNQLVALGLLEQRYNPQDRRVRQNLVTKKGAALLAKVTRHQMARMVAALEVLGEEGIQGMWHGLEALARPEDRSWILPHPGLTGAPDTPNGKVSFLKRSQRPSRNGD